MKIATEEPDVFCGRGLRPRPDRAAVQYSPHPGRPTTMRIQRVAQPINEVKTDWLVLGVFEDEARVPEGLAGTGVGATIERLRTAKEIAGTSGELTVLHEPAGLAAGAALVVGLGPRARF